MDDLTFLCWPDCHTENHHRRNYRMAIITRPQLYRFPEGVWQHWLPNPLEHSWALWNSTEDHFSNKALVRGILLSSNLVNTGTFLSEASLFISFSGQLQSFILCKIILQRSLLGMDNRVIPLQVLQFDLSPFFGIFTSSPLRQSCGIFSSRMKDEVDQKMRWTSWLHTRTFLCWPDCHTENHHRTNYRSMLSNAFWKSIKLRYSNGPTI
jgi:hypothetical protein